MLIFENITQQPNLYYKIQTNPKKWPLLGKNITEKLQISNFVLNLTF